jgi:hypothetical protein
LLTIILTLILLSMAALVYQRIRTASQAAQAEGFFDGTVDEQRLGLSRGLTLLEKGSPSSDFYSCLLTMSDRAGSPIVALSYQHAGDSWSVSASTQNLAGVTAPCPATLVGS